MMFFVRQVVLQGASSSTRFCSSRPSCVFAALTHTNDWISSSTGDTSRCLSTSSHAWQAAHSAGAGALPSPLQDINSSSSSITTSNILADAASDSSSSSSLLSSLVSTSSDATATATSITSSSSSISDLVDAAAATAAAACSTSGSSLGSSLVVAAQPLEPFWQVLNPIVMGCSVWEMVHSTTGLPWWASIPLTTVALRTALLPLTLKAKSAGLNFVLAQQATQTATNLIEHWKQQQAAQQVGSSSSSDIGELGLGQGGEPLKRPSRWRLSRMYYRYYRKQHGTTSLWWWTANIALQLNVFLTMSAALRQMAATQWPGFTEQGLWWFTDLTHASVVFGDTASGLLSGAYCPYGFAGFLLPFGLVVLYMKTIQQSSLPKRSVPLLILLEAFVLPYTWLACVEVPQATLLYWATNSAFFLGLQHALQQPRIARALSLPAVMLPPPQQTREARERAELEALKAQQLVCGSEDDGFLRYLAASYLARGLHQQAMQCLQRLTVLAPGDAAAFRALGTTAAELQHWPLSARAFERAAELHAVAVDREEHVECLLLAAKQWLNATAEARAMQRRGRQQLRASGSQAAGTQQQGQQQQQAVLSPSGLAGAADGAAAAAAAVMSADIDGKPVVPVQPAQQQEYINSALSLLQQAIHFQSDGGADAYYLLSMAQAADGKWEPAFEAATTFWNRSLALAENDQTARINAAAKLLPVLNNLCKQRSKHKDFTSLLTVAQLAVEVAKCGWDRQTEEQLRDTLGAAEQAAIQQGKVLTGQQINELQRQLPCAATGQRL